MSVILDTNFLVNLEREKTRSRVGDAHAFLQANPNEVLLITFTIAAEIACGITLARLGAFRRAVYHFELFH